MAIPDTVGHRSSVARLSTVRRKGGGPLERPVCFSDLGPDRKEIVRRTRPDGRETTVLGAVSPGPSVVRFGNQGAPGLGTIPAPD